MDVRYDWSIAAPRESLSVSIANYRDDRRIFDAGLSLQRRPITSTNLAKALLKFPLMTARITAAIYWQALRLWWKGARFHPHPGRAGGRECSTASPGERCANPEPSAVDASNTPAPPNTDQESRRQTKAIASAHG